MSFEEKSISASLAITVGVWAFYFYNVFSLSRSPTFNLADVAGPLLAAVVLTVILEIVLQAVIAGRTAAKSGIDGAPTEDERDREIRFRAGYYASYVLAVGVIGTIIVALATHSLAHAVNTLVLHFIAAEICRYILQLFYYRRGF